MTAPQLELKGTTLFIDGNPRQISIDDTIFCPDCGEEFLYWQTPEHYKHTHTESEN
jgi:DNA-directed RNA polymerase subunit RPC12/RpoP